MTPILNLDMTLPLPDKTALITEINTCQAIYDSTSNNTNPVRYTSVTWSTFTTVLANAKTVKDKSWCPQLEVDVAKTELINARNGLTKQVYSATTTGANFLTIFKGHRHYDDWGSWYSLSWNNNRQVGYFYSQGLNGEDWWYRTFLGFGWPATPSLNNIVSAAISIPNTDGRPFTFGRLSGNANYGSFGANASAYDYGIDIPVDCYNGSDITNWFRSLVQNNGWNWLNAKIQCSDAYGMLGLNNNVSINYTYYV